MGRDLKLWNAQVLQSTLVAALQEKLYDEARTAMGEPSDYDMASRSDAVLHMPF